MLREGIIPYAKSKLQYNPLSSSTMVYDKNTTRNRSKRGRVKQVLHKPTRWTRVEVLYWNRRGKRWVEEICLYENWKRELVSCQEREKFGINMRTMWRKVWAWGFFGVLCCLLVVVGKESLWRGNREREEKREKEREKGKEKRSERKQTHPYLLAMYYVYASQCGFFFYL